MPKISIITPTYNSSRFIKSTIKSVLNQTYKDWEYLIIDDCSTDNTIEIVNEFIKQDSRIKFFKTAQNSGGPATPKNIGIENARGEYVAFLDHDDEWFPEKLEKQLKIFEKSKDKKLGLVSTFLNIKDNDGKLIYKHKKNYSGDIIKQLANGNFIVTSSCVMTKLNILKEVSFFDINFKTSDDWDMWLRISNLGYTFDFTPKCLVNYIKHDNNVYLGKEKNEIALIYNKHKQLFLKYNSIIIGYYYFYERNYKLAREYFLKNILSLKSFTFFVLTFCPSLESLFKKIFLKIKTLYKF